MVMFRDFTERTATALGVVGTVQNLSDGTVHVVAEGDEEILKKFIAKLHEKPLISRMIAHVDEVKEEWKESTGEFSDFTIQY